MIGSRPAIAGPLIWSTLSNLGTQALSFLTFAILARLLGAPAFGLVAIAALVIDLLLVISNTGINEAVIQRRQLSEADADTAFWMNLVCGLLFCCATALVAPLIAGAFGQPQLTPIIVTLATIFAITPLGSIHTARLTRELRFGSIAMRNLIASVAGAAAGVPLAFAGYGPWALVAQRIAVSLTTSVYVWIAMPWMPRLRFRRDVCSELARFGSAVGAAGTLNQLNIRIAEIISGALVGPVAVAFIRAGSRVVEVLNQLTYSPFQQIAMPVLTRMSQDRDAIKSTYLRLSQLSSFIMFPAFFGVLVLSDEMVALVFGAGWEPVADAVKIFACAVVASQMNNLIVAAITAVGESRTVLSWTSAQIALGVAVALAVHPWGWQAMLITGVARGYLILPYGFYLLRIHVGIHFGDVLSSIRPALISATIMMLALFSGLPLIREKLSPFMSMSFVISIGAALYFSIYFLQDRRIFLEIHNLIKMKIA